MDQGYVKLWRKSLKSRSFQNADLWKVWSWCLMKANHDEAWVPISTGRGETEVHVLPGQFIFGRKTAAKELKMSESSTRNRMEKLRNIGNLTLKSDTHYSIINIVNWESYQSKEIKEDRQQDNQRTTKGQPKDTNKNDKNDKNDKNKKDTLLPEWLSVSLWERFINHRKAVKAPIQKDSWESFIKKFVKLKEQGWEPETVIDTMVEKGWRWFKPEWMKERGNGRSNASGGTKQAPRKEGFAEKNYQGTPIEDIDWAKDDDMP